MTAQEIREFCDYLKACTDRQVWGVYAKEKRAGREVEAELAMQEAQRRGIFYMEDA